VAPLAPTVLRLIGVVPALVLQLLAVGPLLRHRWRAVLTRQDRKAIRRYGIGIVWAITFAVFTPALFVSVATSTTVLILTSCTAVGGAMAMYGRFKFRHITWELRGLTLMVIGLGFYTVQQAILAIFLGIPVGNTDRVALVVFAYWLTSEVADRFEYLGRLWIRRMRAAVKGDFERVEEET
jgi:hypothetical protein